MTKSKLIKDPAFWLIVSASLLFIIHLNSKPLTLNILGTDLLYRYSVNMSFEAPDEDVVLRTFLPNNNARQEIISESIDSAKLAFKDDYRAAGRMGIWDGISLGPVIYNALLSTQELYYQIDPELEIPRSYSNKFAQWLESTEAIPKDHSEISSLWKSIEPDDTDEILSVLDAVYSYVTNEIEKAPFKGFTDALTALRLQQASCNGKGRLFVGLLRHNNIPSRLIGGVILNNGQKRTSHQWIEAYVNGHWVPFDATNGHFASIPANYLELYIGDEVLFSHSRDINFNYNFNIQTERIATSLLNIDQGKSSFPNAAAMLAKLGIQNKTAAIFLLFPFIALLISFLRNIIGLNTFGIFMPMLIATACLYTGFWQGLIGFIVVLFVAYLGQVYFTRHKLLKIPRLAAVITLNTILFIFGLKLLGPQTTVQLGMLTLFPVVIISFIAERLNNIAQDEDWKNLATQSAATLFAITLCYLLFSSIILQNFFAVYPETLLLVLALQILIGKWTGLRITELFRFSAINKEQNTLGINKRNRDYVYTLNDRQWLEIAIDKLSSKRALNAAGITVAQTLLTCRSLIELDQFMHDLEHFENFVIKPNRGSQGNGILVMVAKDKHQWVTASGRQFSERQVRHHIAEIVSGSFAQDGAPDIAYVEPLLIEHAAIAAIANLGLSDIRVIVCKQEIISCMLRIPTRVSGGKANLHQGAIGVSVNIDTGLTEHCSFKGKPLSHHPDSNVELAGREIPFWPKICEMALAAQRAIPLGYIGVDICIDNRLGPLILEVNGRPGLEIQNVQKKGFSNELELASNKNP